MGSAKYIISDIADYSSDEIELFTGNGYNSYASLKETSGVYPTGSYKKVELNCNMTLDTITFLNAKYTLNGGVIGVNIKLMTPTYDTTAINYTKYRYMKYNGITDNFVDCGEAEHSNIATFVSNIDKLDLSESNEIISFNIYLFTNNAAQTPEFSGFEIAYNEKENYSPVLYKTKVKGIIYNPNNIPTKGTIKITNNSVISYRSIYIPPSTVNVDSNNDGEFEIDITPSTWGSTYNIKILINGLTVKTHENVYIPHTTEFYLSQIE